MDGFLCLGFQFFIWNKLKTIKQFFFSITQRLKKSTTQCVCKGLTRIINSGIQKIQNICYILKLHSPGLWCGVLLRGTGCVLRVSRVVLCPLQYPKMCPGGKFCFVPSYSAMPGWWVHGCQQCLMVSRCKLVVGAVTQCFLLVSAKL